MLAAATPYLVTLAGYVALALVMTVRTWVDPAHRTPGFAGDNFGFVDAIAWIPHALSTGHNPLFMSAIDYPHGVNLAWNTSVPLGAVLVWPVTAVFGPVVAFNLLVSGWLALDGWCVWLWLKRHVRSSAAAFAGGALVVLGPWAVSHIPDLQLISYWPVPLMLISLEKMVAGSRRFWRWSLLLGVLGAVQFYLAPEIFAMAVIAFGIGVVVLALARRDRLRDRGVQSAMGIAAAAVLCGLLIAPFVAYQLLGPYAIKGTVQPVNLYVTDLQNLVVPTAATWLWPHSLTDAQTLAWTGAGEATAYIGVPLLLLAVVAAVRWRRTPAVTVVALTSLLVAILSLGPQLHAAGHDTGVPLPGWFLSHLPFLADMLPVRLSLIVDIGVAFLLAVTFDRTLFHAPFRLRPLAVLAVVAAASFISALPLHATATPVPAYFTSAAGARSLPAGTVALVGPYIDADAAHMLPMLWQADADFHFSLIDGLAITSDADGHVTWLLPGAVRDAFHGIQANGLAPAETDALRTQLLAELRAKGVNTVILGPMPHREQATQFVTWLLNGVPHERQGVSLWDADTTATLR